MEGAMSQVIVGWKYHITVATRLVLGAYYDGSATRVHY